MSYQSLQARKEESVRALESGLASLLPELARLAREAGGTITLFGSAARGELRPGSDIDLLLDLPDEADLPTRLAIEDRCAALGLAPDIHLRAFCGPRLLARIAAEGRVPG